MGEGRATDIRQGMGRSQQRRGRERELGGPKERRKGVDERGA